MPFSELEDVRLGMTARDLKQIRPLVQSAPYYGYREFIAGYEVGYKLPGSVSEDQEVPESSRVQYVSAMRNYDNSASAAQAWRQTVATARRSFASAPDCYSGERSNENGVAFWDRDGAIFSIKFTGARTTVGPRISTISPAVLILTTQRKEFTGNSEVCPEGTLEVR
jgi:hypothetical protein